MSSTDSNDSTPTVRKRALGATDVTVSEIALGTWGLATHAYGKVDAARFEATVEAAWEAGITTFDLAAMWGDGSAEKRLGLTLGARLGEAVIIDRIGQSFVDGRVEGQFDSSAVVRDVESSLHRLGRNVIDVVLLHDPPPKVLAADYYFTKGMDYLLNSGVVRTWGVACGTVEQARLAIDQGAQVLSFTHNLLHRETLAALGPVLEERGIGVLARSPLLYGLLAGGYDATTTFSSDDHRSRRWSAESLRTRVEEVERHRFLVDGGVPDLATAALRYVLASPNVGAALVGARTPEQARHAAAASIAPPYLPAEHYRRIQQGFV